MQDRNSAREDFDDIYFDRLMEKYEATQRERELVRRGKRSKYGTIYMHSCTLCELSVILRHYDV